MFRWIRRRDSVIVRVSAFLRGSAGRGRIQVQIFPMNENIPIEVSYLNAQNFRSSARSPFFSEEWCGRLGDITSGTFPKPSFAPGSVPPAPTRRFPRALGHSQRPPDAHVESSRMVFSALALSAAAVVPKALLQQHHSPKRAARVARPDAAPAFATRRRADAGLAASAKSFRGVASRLVIARAGGEVRSPPPSRETRRREADDARRLANLVGLSTPKSPGHRVSGPSRAAAPPAFPARRPQARRPIISS